MENEVLRDILLVITVLTVFLFGFFVMKRLDKFLKEYYKPNFSENEEKPTQIVHHKSASGEEIFSDSKTFKEKNGKVKTIISDEEDVYNE